MVYTCQFEPSRRLAVTCLPDLRLRRCLLDRSSSTVEPDYNILRWSGTPSGGHFVALEEPDLLAEDVQEFFRRLG